MQLSMRRLEYLVAVVDAGSFTGAATVLGVSQPGLSHQVKALEGELGGRLLERSGRGIRLTPMGRTVLPHVRAVLEHARRVEHAARAASEGQGGILDVSTVNSLSLAALPAVLRAWRSEHPGVEVRVHEHADVPPLLDAFAEGEADVAITPLPDSWAGDRRFLGTEELVLAVAPDHRLASVGSASLRDLADEAWVHFTPEHGLAGVLEHLARLGGFYPRPAMRTGQTAAASHYVAAGVGVAILPSNVVGDDCVAVHLDPPIRRNVHLLTRHDGDPLVTRFARCVAEHLPLDERAEPRG